MQETESIEETLPEVLGGVTPYLMVENASKAAAFYGQAFAAREAGRHPLDDEGRTMHIHLYINGGSVMLSDPYPEYGKPFEKPQGFSLTLTVDDIDGWWARALGTGMKTELPLERMFWGKRYGQLRDPFGILWAITER